jgi:hypothetical protein
VSSDTGPDGEHLSFSVGEDGPRYATVSEALPLALKADEHVWQDGSQLTDEEARYLAIREANEEAPEDIPPP